MKLVTLILLATAACAQSDTNVNSQYSVESVKLSPERKIPSTLKADLDEVVGKPLDHSKLDGLADDLKRAFHLRGVEVKVGKGTKPELVAVTFVLESGAEKSVGIDVPRLVYDSKLGWSGAGRVSFKVHENRFGFGIVDDGDQMVERFAGVRASFERKSVGTDRLGLRFNFDAFHTQWNPATLKSTLVNDLYRARYVFSPVATVSLLRQLKLDFGARITRFRLSTPNARNESSNAVVGTLRYHQRWDSGQDVSASYGVVSSTGKLDTDVAYTRHEFRSAYDLKRGHNQLTVGFLAGTTGAATPLFDRFVLGNASTLRGWSKYDLDPRGGRNVAHGSIDYRYRYFTVFYDTGAVWDRASQREAKHSIGTGIKIDNFTAAVAFPIREGRGNPVFLAGVNF